MNWKVKHQNAKGTGAMMEMAYDPAPIDGIEGCLYIGLSPQCNFVFDMSEKIRYKLTPVEAAEILQVLRGECESIRDGKGLYYRSNGMSVKLQFRHVIEPVCGYSLELYESMERVRAYRIFLSYPEALVMSYAIEHALVPMVFGIPK